MECSLTLLSHLILNIWCKNPSFQVEKYEATKHLISKDVPYLKKDEAIRSRFEQSYRLLKVRSTSETFASKSSVSFRIANCLHFFNIFLEISIFSKSIKKLWNFSWNQWIEIKIWVSHLFFLIFPIEQNLRTIWKLKEAFSRQIWLFASLKA